MRRYLSETGDTAAAVWSRGRAPGSAGGVRASAAPSELAQAAQAAVALPGQQVLGGGALLPATGRLGDDEEVHAPRVHAGAAAAAQLLLQAQAHAAGELGRYPGQRHHLGLHAG